MKEIITDNACLVKEIEEVKKSLEIERKETDKYVQLANELNIKHTQLEDRYKLEIKAAKEKRIGGIGLGCIIGLTVGILATCIK